MNQKIIAVLIASSILALPSLSLAETLPPNEMEIRAKITALRAEVSALQKELDDVKAGNDNGHVLRIWHLLGSLNKGTRSDAVAVLQTLLAKDAQIYPEGYVTGYYGTLTSVAVLRFKNKHDKPKLSVESITVPHIFGITATTTKISMTVVWKTDMPTSGKIWWGSPGPLDPERMTPISAAGFSKNHRADFSGIIYASTTYAFIIAASDHDGNTSTTTEQIYVTP